MSWAIENAALLKEPKPAIYVLDNAHQHAKERLTALEAVFDPGTFRVLDTVGVGRGWRCLEIGAGAGAVAAWLGDRVGPTGHVLATDIDRRYLGDAGDGD